MLDTLGLSHLEDEAISIMGDLYIKSPEALEAVLAKLGEIGYAIKNCREEEDDFGPQFTVEQMEQNGHVLWFASLGDIRYGVCGSCNELVSVRGIRAHHRTCEHCGAVLYSKYVDGSVIRFEFLDREERHLFSPSLQMRVKMWDMEEGYLYLYPGSKGGGPGALSGRSARDYLRAHRDAWEFAQIDGRTYIRIKFDRDWRSDTAVIEPLDSRFPYHNHRIVRVWEGKQYPEHDFLADEPFPIPESICIYETWHWAPLPSSPQLHNRILSAARQVSDKGYYYQDGRRAFSDNVWQKMATFVRHFTELDADAFDRAWPTFRQDGPGGIDDLARFCHEAPEITDRPNIFNTVGAIAKGLSGESLTDQEVDAGKRGFEDPNADLLLASKRS